MSIHDSSVTVFSPDGQLLQVQYAYEAVNVGSPAVGVRGKNAVVLGVEKRLVLQLQEDRTEQKIMALDDHMMLAFAGLRADGRVMITRAQMECQSHHLVVADAPTIEYIARYMAELKQKYTHSNGRRPFGISCLIGGFDSDGSPHLFQTEPSGIYYEWKASAIGRGDKTLKELLEKKYSPESVATEGGATKLVVQTLLEVVNTRQMNIQVAVMKRGQPMKMLPQEQINEIVSEINKRKDDLAKK